MVKRNNMKNLRFCMMYSVYSKDKENTGEVKRLGSMHPQKAMKELGITYTNATPQSMGDQWWFWNCENLPVNLPPFLTEMKDPYFMDSYYKYKEVYDTLFVDGAIL